MCFLRHIKQIQLTDLFFDKSEETYIQAPVFLPPQKEASQNVEQSLQIPQSTSSQLFSHILEALLANNATIARLTNKIQACFKSVQTEVKKQHRVDQEMKEDVRPRDPLLFQLFGPLQLESGNKNFSYKLALEGKLPEKFFKNRKFQISVKLICNSARSVSVVVNSCPLDICIGVFDSEGRWVTQASSAQPIIDGMTSVELCRGRGEFTKLCFHDISSNFPKGKLNIAIYAKPGLQRGANSNPMSSCVEWSDIKPLIVKNLTVLSKKRRNKQEQSSE